MKHIKLNVHARTGSGRGPAKRLRASGGVPAVLYGKQTEPASLAVTGAEVNKLLKEIAGTAALIEISQDGKESVLSIVQEIQRNPLTDNILHIDFQEVSAKEEMVTPVNIHIVGEAFGVKNQDATLDFVSYTVDVRCLPKDLPGFIELDVTELKAGESLHVNNLPVLKGVTYLADDDHVIVTCIGKRGQTEEEELEAAEGEAEAAAEEPAKKAE